jgi:hypothetical protein
MSESNHTTDDLDPTSFLAEPSASLAELRERWKKAPPATIEEIDEAIRSAEDLRPDEGDSPDDRRDWTEFALKPRDVHRLEHTLATFQSSPGWRETLRLMDERVRHLHVQGEIEFDYSLSDYQPIYITREKHKTNEPQLRQRCPDIQFVLELLFPTIPMPEHPIQKARAAGLDVSMRHMDIEKMKRLIELSGEPWEETPYGNPCHSCSIPGGWGESVSAEWRHEIWGHLRCSGCLAWELVKRGLESGPLTGPRAMRPEDPKLNYTAPPLANAGFGHYLVQKPANAKPNGLVIGPSEQTQ